MLNRFVYYTIIILFSVFVLMLFVNNQLTFYIHPRYVTFSAVMAGGALIFAVIGFVQGLVEERGKIKVEVLRIFRAVKGDRKLMLFIGSLIVSVFINLFFIVSAMIVLLPFRDSKFDKLLKRNIWGEVLLFGLMFVAFLLPARPLSSATASQRSLDFNSLNVTGVATAIQPFSFSSEAYTIGDWVTSLNINPDISFYVGKPMDVIGFVYSPDGLDKGYFLVSRFVITCCAVDARPVGIPVQYDMQGITQDDWVEVKGKFASQAIGGKQQVVIIPDSVSKVAVPANPYIY